MPPCLGSASSAIDETASKDNAAATASVRTPRMVPSLDIFGLMAGQFIER
jgi:hypothetical protein